MRLTITIGPLLFDENWINLQQKPAPVVKETDRLKVPVRFMTSSLLRRLVIAALALLALTLLAVDYTLTTYSQQRTGAPVDAAVRIQVLAIALGAAVVALGAALVVSRSLTSRVSRLKRSAEGLLSGGTEQRVSRGAGDDLGSLERSLSGVGRELRALVTSLRFESARREAILGEMAEGVLAVDPDLKVTFCNGSLLRAIRFRGESYEGLTLLEVVRDPALYELIRSVLASGEPGKLRFHLSADTPRTFEVQATPLAMPSGRGAIAIFHDITDLERLEQVRKDFVANVSHELRTPLAGIIGYADTLLDGGLEDVENRKRFVEIIRANAVRLGSIAADLLVLSELESGTEPQEPEIISVSGVLEAVLLTVEAEARAREVRLVREEMQDVQVAGSRLRLEQALLNLLANAIKFNRPGGEVRVRVTVNPDGRVAIILADTGVGIPSEDLPRIFERFYRVDKARSRQVGGTGLGLSIVKHVVERMNGTIGVESQLGKGSTFTVLLPVVKREGAMG
jgi:two-component system phosphate regulon sensor histidine kinase PhoR